MRLFLSSLPSPYSFFSVEKTDNTVIEVPLKWVGHLYSELFIDSDNMKYKVRIITHVMDDGSTEEAVKYKTGTVMQITSLSDNKSYHLDLNGQTQVMFIDALKQKNHYIVQANLKYFSLPESIVDLIKNSTKEPQNPKI